MRMDLLLILMVDELQGGEVTKSQKDEALTWKNRGNDLFKQGKFEAALSCYNYGLELDPMNSDLWHNKGFSLYKLGRNDEARKCKEQLQLLENRVPVENAIPIEKEQPIIEEISFPEPVPPLDSTVQDIGDPHISINKESDNDFSNTAKIYGISGSTHYLLKGMHPINGKKFTSLKEIFHFHQNYKDILAETEKNIREQQDKTLSNLNNDEARLDKFLKEGIARRTLEVDANICNLKNQINDSQSILKKIGCQFHYLIEKGLRSYRISSQFTEESRELRKVRASKAHLIANKERIIKSESRNVVESYQYLEQNKPFLIGAQGEEFVIRVLSQLPEEFCILNDVNLRFNPAIHWKNSWIKSSQIDHIVVGPTGVFLVETKKWKASDIQLKSEDLLFQVKRANYALWRYLLDYYRKDQLPKIWNVVVATQGSDSTSKLGQYIDVITPYQLPAYITRRQANLSKDTIENLVTILPYNTSYLPK
jgi:tetratricopeptide (TPR) repeat protein